MNKVTLPAAGAAAALVAMVGVGLILSQHPAQAASDSSQKNIEAMSKIGLDIAPVLLNFANKDKQQVGYGSYLVNAVAGCNDCHSAGPETQYLGGGLPYFGQKPTLVNPATYMGGGRDFGEFPGPGPAPGFAHIVSRNLTPDGKGMVVGGLAEFKTTIRTGKDPDYPVHPNCANPATPNGMCIPAPFDGHLLQIMPWPIYQNMTDYDLESIYAYLSAIPCLEGGETGRCKH